MRVSASSNTSVASVVKPMPKYSWVHAAFALAHARDAVARGVASEGQTGAKKSKVPVVVITALDGEETRRSIGELETIAVLPKDARLVDTVVELIRNTLAPPANVNRSAANLGSN